MNKAIRMGHKVLKRLKLTLHPDKTFIGLIQKGFNFLGVHFGRTVKIASKILEDHRLKLAKRYSQGASQESIGDYHKRWKSWCNRVL